MGVKRISTITYLAYERLAFRMHGQMLTKMCSCFELLLAMRTSERKHFRVSLNMFTQLCFITDANITVITHSFLEFMVHDVFGKCACTSRSVAALTARVRFLLAFVTFSYK